jgi:double-stranded uracil-DNA glycosylase
MHRRRCISSGRNRWRLCPPSAASRAPARTRSYPFHTLPDYLRPGLDLVFVGINPGLFSVQRGHYFARPTSRFWPAFSRSSLSAAVRRSLGVAALGPAQDRALLAFGIGFTDVVKRPSRNAAGLSPADYREWVPRLVRRLARYQPRVACFHGLIAYRAFARYGLDRPPQLEALGPQPVLLGRTRLFVTPNPSPANAHFRLADYTVWYDRLAEFLDSER